MLGVVQTVKSARVSVGGKGTGQIQNGLLMYLCIERGDSEEILHKFLDRVITLRIFEDENKKMNLSLLDTYKKILVVSQFTLSSSTNKGHRPSFDSSESPDKALVLYNKALNYLESKELFVQSGIFGAKMEVESINDGPKTFLVKV